MSMIGHEDAAALAESVRSVCVRLATDERVRAVGFDRLNASGGVDGELWHVLCQQVGVAAIAMPESVGGVGQGSAALGVVAHELGRVTAPVPFVASAVLATGLLVDCDSPGAILESMVGGDRTAAAILTGDGGSWSAGAVNLTAGQDSTGWTIDGTARHVLHGQVADLFVVIACFDEQLTAYVVDRLTPGVEIDVEHVLDGTRPMATVTFTGAQGTRIGESVDINEVVLRNVDRAIAVLSAEQVGSAERLLDMMTGYVGAREQFGRPIGSFQAVKHMCADTLADLEFARSASQSAIAATATGRASWHANLAKAVCSEVLRRAAHTAVQIHGGIGFSWEGPVHPLLRRARTDEVLYGVPGDHWDAVRDRAPNTDDDLGGIDDKPRAEIRSFLEHAPRPVDLRNYGPTPTADDIEPGRAWHQYLAKHGYACLDWPTVHGGADASVSVQGVFAEECARAGVPRQLAFTGIELAGPILIRFGSEIQKARHLEPIRTGDDVWTQLFSEPGAGSDLASVRTRAQRTSSGWRVDGQKVWSSAADCANYGLLLARTSANGHRGLSMFIVPMRQDGITVRPIRQIDGESKINEVFLEDVELPDDALIGEVGQGWAVAMATLGRERITLGAQAVAMFQLHDRMVEAAAARGRLDAALARALVRLWGRAWLLRYTWQRAVAEGDPDSSSAFAALKLMTSETARDLGDMATDVLGTDACVDPTTDQLVQAMLVGRAQTILGGTSEIQRNILAERILGLPRDRR